MAVSNPDECSSFVFVVLCRLRPLRRADHSPRVVLGCVRVKSSAIFKSQKKKGGLGPRWAVLPPSFKNKIILIFTCICSCSRQKKNILSFRDPLPLIEIMFLTLCLLTVSILR